MAIKGNQKAKILITGGSGFMGRWVAKNLLEKGHRVWLLDNFANCTAENVAEFKSKIEDLVEGDIKNNKLLTKLFSTGFDICLHFAAAINVQESIDNPMKAFNDNVIGTFNVLEECRRTRTKMIFMSSALVYKTAVENQAIVEDHALNPSCPYAASKIFGENITLSYYRTYDLPIVILRPFSIYGPWQRSDSEGGVVSIFIDKKIRGLPLQVFGSGEQSRDFFYIEDCAEFIARAAFADSAIGQVFNAGSGQAVKIKDLAEKIAGKTAKIKCVEHHHLHAEIMNMRADSTKAKKLLGWEKRTTLEEGIQKTTEWLQSRELK